MQTRCLGGFSVMWVTKLLISPVRIRVFLPKNDQIWSKICIFGHLEPGLAGSFGAPLVGWLVVVAHGLYLARHLFTSCIFFCVQISLCISGWMTLYMPMAQYITAKVIATTGLTKCAKIVACRSLRSVFAPCSSAFLAISLRLIE